MLNGAAPAFDLDGGMMLVLVRALWDGALLSTFGALIFRAYVMPKTLRVTAPDDAAAVLRPVERLIRLSLYTAISAGLVWFVLQSRDIAGAATMDELAAALPIVLLHTVFGHVLAAQMAALLLAAIRPIWRPAMYGGWPRWWALTLATLATVLQAGHGHAASMQGAGPWLLLASVVHLLAAGGWLGGLLPLLLVVRQAPAKIAATAARWFSPLGKLCVVGMAASAAYQGWVLVGSIPAVVGTAYGWMAAVKFVLLAALFAFAVVNRYRFAPALTHARSAPAPTRARSARRVLVGSIALQSVAGVAVIVAAAVLSALPPSMHVPPVWPFTQTLSLATVQEDPDFKREVIAALLALAAAVIVLVLAVVIRGAKRLRVGAGLAACGLAWLAIPHLDLLFVEVYPTSYQTSPTGFSAAAIVAGAALYPAHCAACHGARGHGGGPAAAALADPPADLTADHLWMHSDGELFWWLSHGIAGPDGALAMPGFAAILSEDERWAMIDYIHANNAGSKFSSTGAWWPPIQAPGFDAICSGRATTLADLRGHVVRLVIGDVAAGRQVSMDSDSNVITIVTAGGVAGPAALHGRCVTNDATVAAAYAIVSGIVAPDLQGADLRGAEFLVDGAGWLRAVQRAGSASSWDDPAVLASQVQDIGAHPIQPLAGSAMPMRMQM